MKLTNVLLACCLLGAVPAASAADAAYPNRPIRLLVGFSPGGNIDQAARTVGAAMSRSLGQQVVVDNRPGAATLIAADALASAAPDGYTLMLATTSTLLSILVQRATRGGSGTLDPVKSFAPVASVGVSPFVIAAHASFPADDIPGFVREVKAHPGRYFYATSGVGSQHHLGVEVLAQSLGLDLRHVPYKGAGQILPDLINGEQIKLAVMSSYAARSAADKEKGRLKVIGIMSGPRLATSPDLASFSELVADFDDAVSSFYIVAPPNTPPAIIQKLSETVEQALRDPQVVDTFAQSDTLPDYLPPAALGERIQRFVERWQRVVARTELQG